MFAKETRATYDTQFNKEMDGLYKELLTIEKSIGRSLRKLQMLKKIQENKVNIPSLRVTEGETSDNSSSNVDIKDIYTDDNFSQMFSEGSSMTDLAISNSFVEKTIISSIIDGQNTTIVKFAYLYTPTFVNTEKDFVNKLILTVQADGHIGAYSISSGKLISRFDISSSFKQYNTENTTTPMISDWSSEVQGFLTENVEGKMSASISDFNGNVYVIEFKLLTVSHLPYLHFSIA